MKLYRYRPLSPFLFKEILYGELFEATSKELNDPVDLDASIDFLPRNVDEIGVLLSYLARMATESSLNLEWLASLIDKETKQQATQAVAMAVANRTSISTYDLKDILGKLFDENSTLFPYLKNLDYVFNEIEVNIAQITKNSGAVCFSENHNNVLMWSHYAGMHNGICMEFNLTDKDTGTCELQGRYLVHDEQRREKTTFVDYRQEVRRVQYERRQQLNFFDYISILGNSSDLDVKTIAKDRWRYYANKIKDLYVTKGPQWGYEQEWRIIDVCFEAHNVPEDRILYYNPSALSAVYFGCRVSTADKDRVMNIFSRVRNLTVTYFQGSFDQDGNLIFEEDPGVVNS